MSQSIERFTTRRDARIFVVLVAAVLALLAACAQQSPPPEEEPPPDPAVELALDRAVVDALRGDSATVSVALTRIGAATQPARLSLGGTLPSGVTATFDPPELTGGQSSSTLTFDIAPEVASATLALEVVVDVGQLSTTQPLDVSITGLTVVGRVEDPYGRPLAGGLAASQGQLQPVDASGGFTLSDLAVPYDLTVASGLEGRLHVFEGLRSPTPVLVPFDVLDEPEGDHAARLEGALRGGSPLGKFESIVICAEGHKVVVHFCQRVEEGDDDYSFNVVWYGVPDQAVTLHALHVLLDSDDGTASYQGYDSLDVTLSSGDRVGWDLDLEPLGQALLEVGVDRGAGIPAGELLTAVAWRPGTFLSFVVDARHDDRGAILLVPDLPGVAEQFDVFAVDGFNGEDTSVAWRAGVRSGPQSLHLLDVPTVSGPQAGESDIGLEDTFSVSGLEGTVKTFVWSSPIGDRPWIAVTTSRDSLTIPDADALGLGGLLPSGTELVWRIVSATADDPDEATTDFRTLANTYMTLFDLGGTVQGEGMQVGAAGEAFIFGPAIVPRGPLRYSPRTSARRSSFCSIAVRRSEIHVSAARKPVWSREQVRTRPTLRLVTSEARSSTCTCCKTAARVTPSGSASELTLAGPRLRWSTMARRVGSPSASKIRPGSRFG